MKSLISFVLCVLLAGSALAATVDPSLDMSYRRVLTLEHGSNFRDGGDYPTTDGKRVVRGQLFRSAAMYAIESEKDLEYLERFDFKTVLDLRSKEERELQPDRWVLKDDDITYLAHDYSIMKMIKDAQEAGQGFDMPTFYSSMHKTQLPQLKMYFDALLAEKTPIVVHCSAGQDRTGFISSMMLSALGVEEQLIMEDYQLSTDFRRPMVEKGDIDYQEAAKTNAFAALMLRYQGDKPVITANPLRTEDGKPFLAFTFEAIKREYGTVAQYLEKELDLGADEVAKLKALYTK